MKKSMLMILLLLIISLVNCGGTKKVSMVKSGKLSLDSSRSVGQVLDDYNFQSKVKWWEAKNGKVGVSVQIDFDKVLSQYTGANKELLSKTVTQMKNKGIKYIEVIFLFVIQGKRFSLESGAIRTIFANGKDKSTGMNKSNATDYLKRIYKNEPIS